jgi:hypothetical protein
MSSAVAVRSSTHVNSSGLDPDITSRIAGSTSAGWRRAATASRSAFEHFLQRLPRGTRCDWASATPEHCRLYIVHLFDQTDAAGVRSLATATVVNKASALNKARKDAGLTSFMDDQRTCDLLQALKRERPPGRAMQVLPLAPQLLVDLLPMDDSFLALRLRALFGVRTCAMLRPSAPTEIRLSSVKVAASPQRIVVIFTLQSKASRIAAVASDSNHVEFLPITSPHLFACPARNLLRLCAVVKELARASQLPEPFSPFVVGPAPGRKADAALTVASTDTLSRSIKELMDKSPTWHGQQSRALRQAANTTLTVLGIDAEQVATRGGWSSAVNNTRINHYSTYRFVADNFAQLLYDGR